MKELYKFTAEGEKHRHSTMTSCVRVFVFAEEVLEITSSSAISYIFYLSSQSINCRCSFTMFLDYLTLI